jgi:L-idonate 5-dehydrogenase
LGNIEISKRKNTMTTTTHNQALVIHAPRDLRIETVEIPEVGANQLLLRVKAGGICGSDLHYYQNGGFGTIRIKEPMVLGHEVSGQISAVGSAVAGFLAGERVAISPSRPCTLCHYCQAGLQMHCLDMRYYGSAMRTPHVQGAFRQSLVVDATQAHKIQDHVSDAEGVMAEPLSVALHAVRRAGPLFGKRVLVTGCGPIGALIVLAAKQAGAIEIVATDMAAMPLKSALLMGADRAINVGSVESAYNTTSFNASKGYFDVLFEASGNARALAGAMEVVRPRGILVQVGMGGDMQLPMNMIVAKEFEMRGAFRFHEEYAHAVEMLNKRMVDVKPLISATISYRDADKAFALAADRSHAMKVMFSFD